MRSFKTIACVAAICAAAAFSASCNKDNGGDEGLSTAAFFSQDVFNYNLTQNPTITIPVVRLGKSGSLSVNVTSTGDSQFSVPTFATIAEGKRLGELTVTYDPSALTYNQVYTINLSIADSKSIYGYKQAQAVIEFPTSYSEYGSGTIVEGWWGEQEDKVMYRRDYAANVYQCYLPDCWGHDSGAGYAVQNYVFYWNTETNMVYCPLRPMGTDNWCIADRGAIACMFGGPGYKEGSSDWMKYIDDWYKSKGFAHPYYDPAKKSFFLSDSAAVSPETGAVVYGTPGEFDVFTLK